MFALSVSYPTIIVSSATRFELSPVEVDVHEFLSI